jgi:hypothetical protein
MRITEQWAIDGEKFDNPEIYDNSAKIPNNVPRFEHFGKPAADFDDPDETEIPETDGPRIFRRLTAAADLKAAIVGLRRIHRDNFVGPFRINAFCHVGLHDLRGAPHGRNIHPYGR